eukprot:UN2605
MPPFVCSGVNGFFPVFWGFPRTSGCCAPRAHFCFCFSGNLGGGTPLFAVSRSGSLGFRLVCLLVALPFGFPAGVFFFSKFRGRWAPCLRSSHQQLPFLPCLFPGLGPPLFLCRGMAPPRALWFFCFLTPLSFQGPPDPFVSGPGGVPFLGPPEVGGKCA